MNTQQYTFPFHVFRAYDIRGKVSLLTPAVVRAIAYALADQFKKENQFKIVLGYDARLTSPQYAGILAEVFESQKIEVIQIGCCSSPMMYFSARQTGGNGIMVTASHNPKSDNGIKWMLNGLPPCPEMIQQVAQVANDIYIETNDVAKNNDEYEIKAEFLSPYQKTLLSDIQLKRPFKIVLDGLNGSAGYCASLILKQLGCEVISIRCNPDGHFPDHAPDPSKEEHLNKLKHAVFEENADIGIALDGDGDRLVLIDETTKVITADRLICLCADMCLSQQPSHEIVYDVKCSTMIRNTVRDLGGIPVMLRTGSTFLRKYIAQSCGQAIFGGEYAGHYVFNDGRGFGYDDGLYAALRILEYLSQSTYKTVSELFEKYPERYSTEDTYISTYQIQPHLVLEEVESKSHSLDAQLSKIDGIRLDFEDGFGIIRASNTGEYFTVRFDADHPARLNHIRDVFASMLSDHYPQIAKDILDAQ